MENEAKGEQKKEQGVRGGPNKDIYVDGGMQEQEQGVRGGPNKNVYVAGGRGEKGDYVTELSKLLAKNKDGDK